MLDQVYGALADPTRREIVKILVQNAEAVEYGQALFQVKVA